MQVWRPRWIFTEINDSKSQLDFIRNLTAFGLKAFNIMIRKKKRCRRIKPEMIGDKRYVRISEGVKSKDTETNILAEYII